MAARAHVEYDPMSAGTRIALQRIHGGGSYVYRWPEPTATFTRWEEHEPAESLDGSLWLRLPEDEARAVYEALADYFGHSGNDTRALRRDYEAERARVDKLIDYATSEPLVIPS